jgi:Uri superfamily endonuclease
MRFKPFEENSETLPTEEVSDSLPNAPGTYTLIMNASASIDVRVGALGERHFLKGLYTYTGSALGQTVSLRTRVARHLRGAKKRRWHIDYLLTRVQTLQVVYCVSPRRLECMIVKALGDESNSNVVVPGFGSSDCSRGCPAHLYHHPKTTLEGLVRIVTSAYSANGCESETLVVSTR